MCFRRRARRSGAFQMPDSFHVDNPDEIHRAQQLQRNRSARLVILSIGLLMVGMAVVDHLLAPTGRSRSIIALSMGGVALLSFLMLPLQPRKLGGALMVTGIFVFATWGIYSYGSVRSTTTLVLMGGVVVAGTYLSLRALWVYTSASVLILGCLTWAEAGGHLVRPEFAPDLRFWLMGCIIMAVIGEVLYHTRMATDEAYLRQLNEMEDRLRLERERDQSQRRFQRIFRLNPTALMIQSAGSRTVLEVNPAFERGFGYSGDQIEGRSAGVLWSDEPSWQVHCKRLFEQGRTGWHPADWRRSDGQVVEVLVSSELNEDPGGMIILTTVMDVPDAQGIGGTLSAGSGARS